MMRASKQVANRPRRHDHVLFDNDQVRLAPPLVADVLGILKVVGRVDLPEGEVRPLPEQGSLGFGEVLAHDPGVDYWQG